MNPGAMGSKGRNGMKRDIIAYIVEPEKWRNRMNFDEFCLIFNENRV
jgi:hypothetical protein